MRIETDVSTLTEVGVPLPAWISRGPAVPAGTRPEVVARYTDSARVVANDPAFRADAAELGLLPGWTDGLDWTRRVEQDRRELAALWAADPWLSDAGQ